jgi:hypothetical protein
MSVTVKRVSLWELVTIKKNRLPRILYDQSQIMFGCECDRSLDIANLSRVHSQDWNVSLVAWEAQSRVVVTCINGTVLESESFKIGRLHSSREVGAVWTIGKERYDVGAVS